MELQLHKKLDILIKHLYGRVHPSKAKLFGQNLWEAGKRIIIAEGELDAITISQTYGSHRWAVVGLKDGATSAINDIKANYEFLIKFDEIITTF